MGLPFLLSSLPLSFVRCCGHASCPLRLPFDPQPTVPGLLHTSMPVSRFMYQQPDLSFQLSPLIPLLCLIFYFFLSPQIVQGQTELPLLKKKGPLSFQPIDSNPVNGGALRVIALRVEFQPDENRFTSGNGTFGPGSLPWLDEPGTVIDPLPHDRNYFEAHMEFTKNYFERVSGNRLTIQYHLIPQIVRLNHEMSHYSPTGENPGFEPLAELVRDAWQKLEDAGGFDLDDIDPETSAFVIFHAGVGRDLELTGTTLDQTPQDIPSLYLSKNALSDLLNEPAFEGFPVNNGDILVPHTIIAPRTLSRRGTDINGDPYVLPLSINGLMAAQIGSRLGLPDLFNTANGRSGIGRFGLMDGAGIFAFNGLFPPEPSAWEKIYLGWESTFEISTRQNEPVSLPAATLRMPDSIGRINLSTDEYFLIENRHRDPEGNGVTLKIQKPGGEMVTQTLTNKDIGGDYVSSGLIFEPILEPGVVTDVSNFDWAVPGGADQDTRELNGGILIWHIDETVIRRTKAENQINSDPGHRGVELKEADGSRDIGRPVEGGLTGNHPDGWAFDFWWEGNNASVITQTGTTTLYENRFGPDTTPDNKSHSGSWSFFELYDFSDNLPIASFRIRPVADPQLEISLETDLRLGEQFYTPANAPQLHRYPYGLQVYEQDDKRFLIAPGAHTVQALYLDESSMQTFSFPPGKYRQPLTAGALVLNRITSDDQEEITAWEWDESEDTFTRLWKRTLPSIQGTGLLSSTDGDTLLLDHSVQRILLDNGSLLDELNQPEQSTARIRNQQAVLSGTNLDFQSIPFISPLGEASDDNRAYASLLSYSGDQFGILLLGDDKIYFQKITDRQKPTLLVESEFLDWPAIADLNRDGFPEIIYVEPRSGSLEAVNMNGAVPDHFPIFPPTGVRFSGTPLISDLSGSGDPEILITGVDAQSLNLYAFAQDGQRLDPFPLLIGPIDNRDRSFVTPIIEGQDLYAVGPKGDFKQWKLPFASDEGAWNAKYGNHPFLKVSGIIESGTEPGSEFGLLNKNETYNWPNPAEDETFLRVQVRERMNVNIKITTMSGRLIYHRTVEATGGVAEEIRIDTSTWASGGYFALITASSGNRSERKLVRIGIVR